MGQRVCLGQHLATVEIRAIDTMILQPMVTLLSVPTAMTLPKPALRVTLRPNVELHLTLQSDCGY